jgi:hypothetical protein
MLRLVLILVIRAWDEDASIGAVGSQVPLDPVRTVLLVVSSSIDPTARAAARAPSLLLRSCPTDGAARRQDAQAAAAPGRWNVSGAVRDSVSAAWTLVPWALRQAPWTQPRTAEAA